VVFNRDHRFVPVDVNRLTLVLVHAAWPVRRRTAPRLRPEDAVGR
jgi:hypothetical protein